MCGLWSRRYLRCLNAKRNKVRFGAIKLELKGKRLLCLKKKARKQDLHRFPKKSKVKNESGHPCQLYGKGMCGPSLC